MKKLIATLLFTLSAVFAAIAETNAEDAARLHREGAQLLQSGKISEGRAKTEQAMDLRLRIFGEESTEYISSLANYGMSFCSEANYKRGAEILTRVLYLCGKLDKPHPDFFEYARMLGNSYYLQDDRLNAVKYWEMALPYAEQFSEKYGQLIDWMATAYVDLHDTDNAARMLALSEAHNRHELEKNCDAPDCMLERAKYYAATGNNAEARNCFLALMAMPMDDRAKIESYRAYASFLHEQKNFAEAAEYTSAAAAVHRAVNGDDKAYAALSYIAGVRYYLGKKYEKAIECIDNAVVIYADMDNDSSWSDIARCKKIKGNALFAAGRYAEAVDAYSDVAGLYRNFAPDSEDYPKALEKVASGLKAARDYDNSMACYVEVLRLYSQRGMTVEYASAHTGLQMCCTLARKECPVEFDETMVIGLDKKETRRILTESLESLYFYRQYAGKFAYAQVLGTIAGCYSLLEDRANALDYYGHYISGLRDGVADEFRMQRPAERSTLWNEVLFNINQLKEQYLTLPPDNEDYRSVYGGLLYDTELLSKGILLNSAVEFENLLQQKGDPALSQLYAQTRVNAVMIEQLRNTASNEEDLQKVLRLERENHALQLQLYGKCAEFADYTDYINYTWRDVQKSLHPGDLAVEFVVIGDTPVDAFRYLVAVTLTDDDRIPQIVTVDNIKNIKALVADSLGYARGGNPVWGALSDRLDGKKRVFFAADGALHSLGVEYLAYDGAPFSEQFGVYRLSSTKQLCRALRAGYFAPAALFGDINYNDFSASADAMPAQSGNLRGSGDVDGFANLDNTLYEIEDIAGILKPLSSSDMRVYTDTDASKSGFLSLDGSGVNVIHIATHGVYSDVGGESESMTNSALAFAGANLGPEGMLTAAEIAGMNLRDCGLAVLSACDSGLGRLGADGVFGLQRGFKNAGVVSLLMSLRPVYDDTTATLMADFYRAWTSGKSKRAALVEAQRKLRSDGLGPDHWAAFILLDALD